MYIFIAKQIVVAPKADSLYPIVSAASIVAKQIRDDRINTWFFPENIHRCIKNPVIDLDVGPGYPGKECYKKKKKTEYYF